MSTVQGSRGEPSADAIASIITQVHQSGPIPTRAARPVKVAASKKKKKLKDAAVAPSAEVKHKVAEAAEAGAAAAAEQAGTAEATAIRGADGGTSAADQEKERAQEAIRGADGGTSAADQEKERAQEASADATLAESTNGSTKHLSSTDPSSSKDGVLSTQPPVTTTDDPSAPPSPVAGSGSKTTTNGSSLAARSSNKPAKKQRKLIHILLPCFHPSGHTPDDADDGRTAGMFLIGKRGSNKLEMKTRNGTASATTPSAEPKRMDIDGGGGNLKPTKVTTKLRASSGGSATPKAGRQSSADQPPPSSVLDTVTAAVTASTGGGGVLLPRDETEGVLSGAVVPPGKEGSTPKKIGGTPRGSQLGATTIPRPGGKESVEGGTETDEGSDEESGDGSEEFGGSEEGEEDRIVAMGGMGIPVDEYGVPRPLLSDLDLKVHAGKKCLVLDLDETLVHSSFKMIHQADFIVPVEIENSVHNVYVIKRPGVDQFMKRMGELYEVVVFTASLSKYADPVLDMLDTHRVVKHRLFRESCYNHKGNYVKDLSQLGRPIGETIIIDNSPASYIFHPNNAVPVSSWFNDPHDTELTDLVSFLADVAQVSDVRAVLDPRLT